jgi:hypothetical protein
MPGFTFGFAMLRNDLSALAGLIVAGNEIQAEILSERLITDLRQAGTAPPTYGVHLPTARMYIDVAVYIYTCLVNINSGRLDLALVSVRDAHALFRASPWYPMDDPPPTPATKDE